METINVIPNIRPSFIQQVNSSERNFLICRSCFWCASYFNNMRRSVETCPSCNDAKLESMPISFDETYRFHYDSGRGVILEFGTAR
jgi:hypothetical protein